MAWQGYRLVYRLLAPLHIGYHTSGNVQRTRHYVLGRNMWGVVTARLARLGAGDDEPKYAEIGKEVEEHLRFGYFYPTADLNEVALPPYDDAWERRFISALASTAIAHDSVSAADESLHETEFIIPRIGDDNKTVPVYLVGYLWVRENNSVISLDELWPAITELQIGGEQGYGWGRIQLHGHENENRRIFDYDVDLTADEPRITIPKDKPLPAHTQVNGVAARGEIEPLVFRSTTQAHKYGAELSQAKICWAPGAVAAVATVLQVLPYGILAVANAGSVNAAQ